MPESIFSVLTTTRSETSLERNTDRFESRFKRPRFDRLSAMTSSEFFCVDAAILIEPRLRALFLSIPAKDVTAITIPRQP